MKQIPQLWFAGCDTESVRALRTLMGLNDPDHPHLSPSSVGPGALFKLSPGPQAN